MIYRMLIVFTAIHMSLESSFKEELMDTAHLLTEALLTLYLLTGNTSVPSVSMFAISSEAEHCLFKIYL